MRVLLYSDLHGSVKNIRQVFDSETFDMTLFAGDLFGYFVLNNEELQYFLDNTDEYILGNHDLYFLREIDAKQFRESFALFEDLMVENERYNTKYGALKSTISQLNLGLTESLFSVKLSRELEIGNRKVLMCHGSPDNVFNEYVYPDCEKFDKFFTEHAFDLLIVGHSHKAFVVEQNGRFIVNPGSCTLPRGGEEPSYAIWDTETMQVEIHRMEQTLEFKRVSKSQVTLLNQ